MDTTKIFGGNHNLAYDNYELFGLPENSRTVDSSAFEELFGKSESGLNANQRPQHQAKTATKKAERKPAGENRSLFKVLSGLMTMSIVLLLFSIIIS